MTIMLVLLTLAFVSVAWRLSIRLAIARRKRRHARTLVMIEHLELELGMREKWEVEYTQPSAMNAPAMDFFGALALPYEPEEPEKKEPDPLDMPFTAWAVMKAGEKMTSWVIETAKGRATE